MSNPNKTVAAARKRMGGFPNRQPPPTSEFMQWVFDQAAKGVIFVNEEDARQHYAQQDADKLNQPEKE